MKLLNSVSLLLALSWPFAKAAILSVRLDESFPSSIRGDLTVVAGDVAEIVSEMFGSAQPPFLVPIVCIRGIPPPRTSLDNWSRPTQIRINLSVGDRGYAQFAFQ